LYFNQHSINHMNRHYQFLSIIIIIILAIACNNNKKNSPVNTAAADSTKTEVVAAPDILQEYQTYLSKLDSTDKRTTAKAVQMFQALFKNAAINTRDSGFILFEQHYTRVNYILNDKHYNDTTNYLPLFLEATDGEPVVVSKKVKAYEDSLKAYGFTVMYDGEGGTYVGQDRDFIAKHFYNYVSATMKEYLEQVNKENKAEFSADAGIIIDPKKHVDRIIWWENFIREHPDFRLAHTAIENKKYYLLYLLTGMDNTPVLSHSDQSLEAYYNTAYTYLEKTYPDSETNKLVNPYYKALLQKDTAKANALVETYKKKRLVTVFE
jgi:hypothetical protein